MENYRPENILGKSLDAMSTENLQELLRNEMDADRDLDVDLVKAILSVLDARTEQKDIDVDAAWDRFFHNHLPSEPIVAMPEDTPIRKKGSRKKHLIRIGLIAALIAVFCLGAGLTASAAGYDVWDTVMQWSSETFGFSFGQNNGTASMKYNPEYTDMWVALEDSGITVPVLPKYLPDGYKQVECDCGNGYFFAGYENGDSVIIIQIQEIINQDNMQHEKDQVEPEKYIAGKTEHYISTNMGEYIAAWTHNGYECLICGVQTKQELLMMIDSIYMEESK